MTDPRDSEHSAMARVAQLEEENRILKEQAALSAAKRAATTEPRPRDAGFPVPTVRHLALLVLIVASLAILLAAIVYLRE